MQEPYSGFEKVLAEKGYLVYGISGVSMQPMLRQKRDQVLIRPVKGRLQRYDIALYRYPSGKYVLHRVIRVLPDGYVIRGDNCYADETGVTDEMVLGTLEGVIRNGKQTSVRSRRYTIYAKFWVWSYPIRKALRVAKGFLTEGIWAHFRLKKQKK